MKKRIENSALVLLSAKQAAESLGISQRKLWSLTNARAIASIKIGRAIRYSVDDLQSFVQAARTVAK